MEKALSAEAVARYITGVSVVVYLTKGGTMEKVELREALARLQTALENGAKVELTIGDQETVEVLPAPRPFVAPLWAGVPSSAVRSPGSVVG